MKNIELFENWIQNQQSKDKHFIFKNLKDRYLPFGFKENKNPGDILSIDKGDDMNGASIQNIPPMPPLNPERRIAWNVTINGQDKVKGEAIPNGYNEEQIFNQITKAIDPYKNYRFKQTPAQG